jgi:hypothetical protein
MKNSNNAEKSSEEPGIGEGHERDGWLQKKQTVARLLCEMVGW